VHLFTSGAAAARPFVKRLVPGSIPGW